MGPWWRDKKKKNLDLQNLEQLQAPMLTNRVILNKQTPLRVCSSAGWLPYPTRFLWDLNGVLFMDAL